jgi:hypothetical protein
MRLIVAIAAAALLAGCSNSKSTEDTSDALWLPGPAPALADAEPPRGAPGEPRKLR